MSSNDVVNRGDPVGEEVKSTTTTDWAEEHPSLGSLSDDFVGMYRHHYTRIIRALELGGASHSTAEDITQEAFARTLLHWRRIRRGSNPPGYVYRVAFRLAWRASSSDVHLAHELTVADIAAEATMNVDIETTLERMPDARRRCAVLCLVVGLSTKEAAAALHIAESTVRKQIERARVDLHLALDDSE